MERIIKTFSIAELLSSQGPFLERTIKVLVGDRNCVIYPEEVDVSALDPEAEDYEDPSVSWEEARAAGGTYQFEYDNPQPEEPEEEAEED